MYSFTQGCGRAVLYRAWHLSTPLVFSERPKKSLGTVSLLSTAAAIADDTRDVVLKEPRELSFTAVPGQGHNCPDVHVFVSCQFWVATKPQLRIECSSCTVIFCRKWFMYLSTLVWEQTVLLLKEMRGRHWSSLIFPSFNSTFFSSEGNTSQLTAPVRSVEFFELYKDWRSTRSCKACYCL